MVLIEYKCNKCKNVFDEFRPEQGSAVCPHCGAKDTEQNYSGKCYGVIGGASSGGCSGGCSGCSGCKK